MQGSPREIMGSDADYFCVAMFTSLLRITSSWLQSGSAIYVEACGVRFESLATFTDNEAKVSSSPRIRLLDEWRLDLRLYR